MKNNSVKVMILIFMFVLFPGFLKPAFASSNRYKNEGKYLFHYYNCDDCHSINGLGGTLGPSLSGYGRIIPDFNWTVKQIEDPYSHFKRGDKISIYGKTYYVTMPSYNYISLKDIKKIAAYLESLKK
ncbi:MAG: c-type cytochrome [Deltaproteobacteria bacterium]|nr:c-type cytochrome [Deltaproteobacteria bacterium]